MNKRIVGSEYEELACDFLVKQHIIILERNFRVRQGEIDVIGLDGNTVVFFEVKYRKGFKSGFPEEAVSIKKQKQISRIALFYISFTKRSLDLSYRFDVIGIFGNDITWIKNAFPFHL